MVADKEFIEYVGKPLIYLEIADRRMVIEPYGPRYPQAVGRIFRLVPGGAPPIGDSEADVAFVDEFCSPSEKVGQKPISASDFPQGAIIPIRIYYKFRTIPHYHAEFFLARINYEWPNRIPDLRGWHGRLVSLWVIRESMERFTLEYYEGKRDKRRADTTTTIPE